LHVRGQREREGGTSSGIRSNQRETRRKGIEPWDRSDPQAGTLRPMLKPTIFREYDIRGVADVELLSDDIEILGQAFGTYLQRHGGRNIDLGRDTRLSSPRLRDALMRGLVASGCHVTDLGVSPTPVLYYSVFHLKADGGVMITGSHNPPEFNGFKVVCGTSTIHGEAIQEIRRMIETGDLARGEGSHERPTCVTPYIEEISSQFHFPRRIRVVVDAGNGTGGPVMGTDSAKRLNVDATEMFFEMDGRFPNHHPDPTVPANLQALIAKVLETKADLGIAFDGDTDRIGAVDDKRHGPLRRPVDDHLWARDPDPQAGRDFYRRSEVLAADV
jgi:phosphomannomutase / phosphoglucomutase